MKLKSIEFVKKYIQPVLNVLGGEIFGGFVRDLSLNLPFKDVDINYPHSYSEANLITFVDELRKSVGSEFQVTMLRNFSVSPYITLPGGPVSHSKIVIAKSTTSSFDEILSFSNKMEVSSFEEELRLDLVWDHRGDNQLDLDIHAIYLDSSWNIKVYPQMQYRFALFNLKHRYYSILSAMKYRVEKISTKKLTSRTKVDGVINRNLVLTSEKDYQLSTSGKFIPPALIDDWEFRFPVTCPGNSAIGSSISAFISPQSKEGKRALYSKRHSDKDQKINLQIVNFLDLGCKASFAKNDLWPRALCLIPKEVGSSPTKRSLELIPALDRHQYNHYYVMVQPEGWI